MLRTITHLCDILYHTNGGFEKKTYDKNMLIVWHVIDNQLSSIVHEAFHGHATTTVSGAAALPKKESSLRRRTWVAHTLLAQGSLMRNKKKI